MVLASIIKVIERETEYIIQFITNYFKGILLDWITVNNINVVPFRFFERIK